MSAQGLHSPIKSDFTQVEADVINGAAAAAPSLYNSQPWRVRVGDGEVSLFADMTHRSPHADPDDRQLVIACGAALFNVRLAVRHLGFVPIVTVRASADDNVALAVVSRGAVAGRSSDTETLFGELRQRHTNRYRFADQPLSPAVRQTVRYAAVAEGAIVTSVRESNQRQATASLVIAAIRDQMAKSSLATEMAGWLRATPERDGMTASAWQSTGFPVPGVDEPERQLNWELQVARMLRTHEFLLLSTKHDQRFDWLTAGQALQRLLLCGSHLGISASFFNQAIESPTHRSALAERLGVSGHPQLLLRLGYPTQRPPETRRRRDR